jgi:hypothetical protein
VQEATTLLKHRGAFRIWLMQPDSSKEKREIEEEEGGGGGEEEEKEKDKYCIRFNVVQTTLVAMY